MRGLMTYTATAGETATNKTNNASEILIAARSILTSRRLVVSPAGRSYQRYG